VAFHKIRVQFCGTSPREPPFVQIQSFQVGVESLRITETIFVTFCLGVMLIEMIWLSFAVAWLVMDYQSCPLEGVKEAILGTLSNI
jgi:hypothetical protein